MKDPHRTHRTLLEENTLLKQKIQKLEQCKSENKNVQETLWKSEEYFKAIIQNSSDVILVVDRLANITYASPSVERVLGYRPDDLIGTRTLDLIASDDKRRSIEDFRRALTVKEGLIPNQFHLKHKDGTKLSMEGVGTNLLDNPTVAGFVMNFRDITDRKRAEDALWASKAHLDNALEMAHLGHWEYDVAEDLFIFNDQFYKIFRTTAEEIGGYIMRSEDYARRFVYPDDINTVGEEIRKAIETTDPFFNRQIEHRMIYADGTVGYISVRFFIVKNAHGRTVKTYGVNQDITERKQVEAKLRQQTDAMDAAVDGMALLDEKGGYIYLNKAHVMVYGYESAEELIGKSWRVLYDSDELRRFDQEVMPEFGRKGYWYGEAVGMKKDGTTFPQEVSLTAMANGGLICVVRDITERTKVERKLHDTFVKSQELEFMVNNSPAVVWLWKAVEGWPVEYVSDSIKLYGYTPEDFTSGRVSYISIVHPDDLSRVGAEVEQYTREGKFDFTQEYRIFSKSGDIRWIDDRTWIRRGHDGSVTHYQGIVIDITERKKTEEALRRTLENLRKAFGTTIQVMVASVEARDPYTAGHQLRVANLARAIATEMGLPLETIEGIRMAGSIHDIGKLAIPAEILSKPTKLEDIEFSLIKEHPQRGYEILKDVESPWPLAQIVYQHHERMNGSGYPRGLKGTEILMEARIMAVADVVEAMASNRPYRPTIGLNAALDEIEKNKGELYDVDAVNACLKLFREKGFQFRDN